MRKLLSFLVVLILIRAGYGLINSTYDSTYRWLAEGQMSAWVTLDVSYDSELKLPVEGDIINTTFTMSPIKESIYTNETYSILFYMINSDGTLYNSGFSRLPPGPYEYDETYITKVNFKLDVPGFWQLKYIVVNNKDIDDIMKIPFSDFIDHTILESKRIHVLSFNEAQSIRNSKLANQLNKFSIFAGLIGTLFGVILGVWLNRKITLDIFDRENRPHLIASVKIKRLNNKNIELDKDNLDFRERLKKFYYEKTLKKFIRYGLFIEIENMGKGDALFSWVVFKLKYSDSKSKLYKSDWSVITLKEVVDKMNRFRETQMIKSRSNVEFFVKEVTFIPSFNLELKKIIYVNPITEKSYKGITGCGGMSSLNPNISHFKFDK